MQCFGMKLLPWCVRMRVRAWFTSSPCGSAWNARAAPSLTSTCPVLHALHALQLQLLFAATAAANQPPDSSAQQQPQQPAVAGPPPPAPPQPDVRATVLQPMQQVLQAVAAEQDKVRPLMMLHVLLVYVLISSCMGVLRLVLATFAWLGLAWQEVCPSCATTTETGCKITCPTAMPCTLVSLLHHNATGDP